MINFQVSTYLKTVFSVSRVAILSTNAEKHQIRFRVYEYKGSDLNLDSSNKDIWKLQEWCRQSMMS
jgi:hypothetical protein